MPISLSGSLNLSGSLTTTGTITATTLVVQTITSSIVYSSGSNIFGNSLTNVQQMTGSLRVTGSGNHYIQGGDVGINETSANIYAKMQVTATSGATFALANPSAAAAGVGNSIWFYGTTGYTTQGVISTGWDGASNANAYMAFFTRGTSLTERMRITSGGSVSIGNTQGNSTFTVSEPVSGNPTRELNVNTATAGIVRLFAYNRNAGGIPLALNDPGGSVLIGNTTDYGYKLSIIGTNNLYIQGGTTTSFGSAIVIQDSAGTDLFTVRNDGFLRTGLGSASPYNFTSGAAANGYIDTDGALRRSTSSLKYKTDVRNYDKGLTEVLQIRPVYYKGKNDGDTQFAGLIAEEVHELGLTEFVQYAEDGTPDALAYGNMIALLTKAIQEQQAIITSLQERLTALENK